LEFVVALLEPLNSCGTRVGSYGAIDGHIVTFIDLFLFRQSDDGSVQNIEFQFGLSGFGKSIIGRTGVTSGIGEGNPGDGVLEVGVDEPSISGPLDGRDGGFCIDVANQLSGVVDFDFERIFRTNADTRKV
jgi:hypothetical protein